MRDPRSGRRRQRPFVGVSAALALVAIVVAAAPPGRAAPGGAAPAAPAASESRRGPPPGAAFRDCADCPQMVVVSAGRSTMGSVPEHRIETEQPAELQPVEIAIERPFALGRYEVTRREFARFVAATGYAVAPGCRTWNARRERFDDDPARTWRDPAVPESPRDDHPVACIDWKTARAYAAWLAATTGRPYRLPSEAEWEYAARAGASTLRPWGDSPDDGCRYANVYDLDTEAKYPFAWTPARCHDGHADVAPVGSLAPNAFGLHDMLGNVWEWTEDCSTQSYVGRPTDGRAWVWDGGCARRIQRGGGWITAPDRSRPGFHGDGNAEDRADFAGFRVALDLDPANDRASANGRPPAPAPPVNPGAGATTATSPVPAGRAVAAAPAGSPTPVVLRDCADCPDLVVVPAGEFALGTSADAYEVDASTGETPPLRVTIARPFAIGRTEVTNAQYRAFASATGRAAPRECRAWRDGWRDEPFDAGESGAAAPRDDAPVVCVDHADATAYAEWLSSRTGRRYRLPSESEWEHAARGGRDWPRYWTARHSHEGVSISTACDYANVYDLSGWRAHPLGVPYARCRDDHAEVAPVASFQPNAYGVHDAIGNVREWLRDCYTVGYKGRPADARAWEWQGGCDLRVVRGGSWASRPRAARAAARDAEPSARRQSDLGFRIVRELEPGEPASADPGARTRS